MSDRHDISSSPSGSETPSKRRSRFVMKIIPSFGAPKDSPPPSARSSSQERRFNTFPRVRPATAGAEVEEPVETLATHFSVMAWQQNTLSPPSSASSYTTTFSSSQGGSSAATSPEMTNGDLPGSVGRASWGKKDGSKVRAASSRESLRTFFSQHNSPNSSTQTLSKITQQCSDEADWEKTLEDAATRASWQSSISHRPRQKHRYTPSSNPQSTWPRIISSPVHQRDSLMLEHVFVDASDDGASSYASSAYSGYPMDNESCSSLPMGPSLSSASFASSVFVGNQSQRAPGSPLVHGNAPMTAVPMISISSASSKSERPKRAFDTLPRASKGRIQRPSTTGSSVRGEPVAFGLRNGEAFNTSRSAASPVLSGSASLGRVTDKQKKRPYLDPNVMWSMGRRRSSGRIEGLPPSPSSVTVPTTANTMPTIPQGHSRETSLADDDDEQQPLQTGQTLADGRMVILPSFSAPHLGAFGRKISIAASEYSDEGGDFIPLRLGSLGRRASSQDPVRHLAPASSIGPDRPIKFDLTSFQTAPLAAKEPAGSRLLTPPITPRTSSCVGGTLDRRFSRSGLVPDVPETASEAEDGDLLDYDYNTTGRRRRSTFSVPEPSLALLSAAAASPARQTSILA